MKKKISNLPLKKFFACCGLVLALISICVPCFAQEPILVNGGYYWGSISDVPTGEMVGYFSTTTSFTSSDAIELYNQYYNSTASAYLVDIVKKQYEIGLYGGSVPVAIGIRTTGPTGSASVNRWYTCVYCIRQSDLVNYVGADSKMYSDYGLQQETANAYLEKNGIDMDYYYIYVNGDVEYAGRTSGATIPTSSGAGAGLRMVATYDNGYWTVGGNNSYASYFTYGTTVPTSYNNIMSLYDDTEKTPQYISNEYELDIPSIITAIPNGAKQIINNAFGFEIFGINVAGLLSVLLVVTIVAFVVKWLMSR